MNPIPKVLDLSHWDTVTSFEAIQSAGIQGVIQKATEGTTITDNTYAGRRSDIADTDLHFGAYHYLTSRDAVGQAHHFLDVAQPSGAMEIAADHEAKGVSLATLIQFLGAVYDQTKRRPLIYSGALIKEQIKKASTEQKQFLALHRLWLSHYSTNPKWPSLWTKPFLIQFTGDGAGPGPHTINGAKGPDGFVDLSSFDGTDEELAAQWAA